MSDGKVVMLIIFVMIIIFALIYKLLPQTYGNVPYDVIRDDQEFENKKGEIINE